MEDRDNTYPSIGCMKYLWDNPMTGRTWCQCGHCGNVVSRKADTCRHCGAHFQNMKNGKLVLK